MRPPVTVPITSHCHYPPSSRDLPETSLAYTWHAQPWFHLPASAPWPEMIPPFMIAGQTARVKNRDCWYRWGVGTGRACQVISCRSIVL
jgi:hypothetical protein